jgi:hypothetical protein
MDCRVATLLAMTKPPPVITSEASRHCERSEAIHPPYPSLRAKRGNPESKPPTRHCEQSEAIHNPNHRHCERSAAIYNPNHRHCEQSEAIHNPNHRHCERSAAIQNRQSKQTLLQTFLFSYI